MVFDMASVAAAAQAITSLRGLIGVAIESKADAQAQGKILAAQQHLGSIQDVLFALREELSRLQAEKAELDERLKSATEWADRLSEYVLGVTEGGAVVLQHGGTPAHFACPSCANRRELQPLQNLRTARGLYGCPGCKATYPIDKPTLAAPKPAVSPFRHSL